MDSQQIKKNENVKRIRRILILWRTSWTLLHVLHLFVSATSLPVHLCDAHERAVVFQDTTQLIKMQFILSVARKFYEIPQQIIFHIQRQNMTLLQTAAQKHGWINMMGIKMVWEIMWKQITHYCIRISDSFYSRQAALLRDGTHERLLHRPQTLSNFH